MVHEKGLARTGRPDNQFVTVGDDAPAHRFVRDVQMQRFPVGPVCHLDAERRQRIRIVRLPGKEADSLLDESIEGLLGRKITLAAGNARPVQGRRVNGIVTGLASHQCQSRTSVVLYHLELLPAVRPCHDIAMATDGGQPEGVRLVQISVDPLLVELVGTAVLGKRMHVACRLLEALQDFRRIVYEQELVVDMVTGKHQPHRGGKAQTAVTAVGGVFLVPGIRPDRAGKIVHIGKGVHAENIVPDTHFRCAHLYIFQRGRVLLREGEIFLDQPGLLRRADNLIGGQPFHADKGRVVQDALEVVDTFQKAADRVLVPDFLRDDVPPAEDGEVALFAAPLLGCPGDEEILLFR